MDYTVKQTCCLMGEWSSLSVILSIQTCVFTGVFFSFLFDSRIALIMVKYSKHPVLASYNPLFLLIWGHCQKIQGLEKEFNQWVNKTHKHTLTCIYPRCSLPPAMSHIIDKDIFLSFIFFSLLSTLCGQDYVHTYPRVMGCVWNIKNCCLLVYTNLCLFLYRSLCS